MERAGVATAPPAARGARRGRSTAVAAGGNDRAARLYAMLLGAFVALSVTKVHEVFSPMAYLPWVKVVGGLVILTSFTMLKREHAARLLRSTTGAWLGVFVFMVVVSVPTSLWKYLSVQFLTQGLWKYLVLFVTVGTAAVDRRARRIVLNAYTVGAAIVAARILSGAGGSVVGRAYAGSTFDPNESALMLLVALPLAVNLGMMKGKYRYAWWVAAVLVLGAIVKTGSRGGFIGLCAIALWYLARTPGRRKPLAIAAVGVGAVIFTAAAGPEQRERLFSVFNLKEDYNYTSREGRKEVWKRGFGYMLKNPVLGVGVACFPVAEGVLSGKEDEGFGVKYGAAHNSFIQVGAELGVLGLIAFTGMLAGAFHGTRRGARGGRRRRGLDPHADEDRLLAIAIEGGLVAFVVTGFFLSFAYQMVTFFLLAVGAAAGVSDRLAMMSLGLVPARANGAAAGRRR